MDIKYLIISGHPDDFMLFGGGTGLKILKNGGMVKYISLTMGEQGNPFRSGGEYARIRDNCCQQVQEKYNIKIETWNLHDGELQYTLDLRMKIIQAIREFKADVIVCPHPFNKHPDLKNVSELTLDAVYFSTIPNMLPLVPALKKKPIVLNAWWHEIRKGFPFITDLAIETDDIIDELVSITGIHGSTIYEWAAFSRGMIDNFQGMMEEERLLWHRQTVIEPLHTNRANIGRNKLIERYGKEKGEKIRCAEVFEISDYGRTPTTSELKGIFPF